MSRLPWMKLYPQAYDADTISLTLEEDGLYSRMLRRAWYTSDDGCSLPSDLRLLSRTLLVDVRILRRSRVIDLFWIIEGDRLVSPRLRVEARKSGNQSKAQSDRAKSGWSTRYQRAMPETSPESHGAVSGQCPSDAIKMLEESKSKDSLSVSSASTGRPAPTVPPEEREIFATRSGTNSHPVPEPDAVHRLVAAGIDSIAADELLAKQAAARERIGGGS